MIQTGFHFDDINGKLHFWRIFNYKSLNQERCDETEQK